MKEKTHIKTLFYCTLDYRGFVIPNIQNSHERRVCLRYHETETSPCFVTILIMFFRLEGGCDEGRGDDDDEGLCQLGLDKVWEELKSDSL